MIEIYILKSRKYFMIKIVQKLEKFQEDEHFKQF